MPHWRRIFRRHQANAPVPLYPPEGDQAGDLAGRPWYFVSLRWKLIFPLAVLTLVLTMTGAYVISSAVARGQHDRTIDQLLATSRTVADRMALLSADQQRETARLIYTEDIAEQVAAGNSRALHAALEPLAAAADLDYVLVTGADGREVIGLQRVTTAAGQPDYAVAAGTDLSTLAMAFPTDEMPASGGPGINYRAALVRTGHDHALLTAGPVLLDGEPVGSLLAGQNIDRVLVTLRGGDQADLALFGADGEFVRTTLPFDESTHETLTLAPQTFEQALRSPGQIPVMSLVVNNRPTNAAFIPLVIGESALGVVGVYEVDDTLFATEFSRDLIGVLSAALVALVVIVTFGVMGRVTGRVERVTQTAYALSSGDAHARTQMRPADEIGELGATLDRMADRHQRRTDSLQHALRRQRAETARLSAVLESIPDGIVVQDLDGRVLLINDAARELLGGHRTFRAARLHELTAIVTETLGPALAPGIYALGDPTQVPLDEKMLQAQAAAIVLKTERIGTVIVLRDITADVRRDQVRDALLDRLATRAEHRPTPQTYESLAGLAQEVVRNTRAIQRVIAELRDLSTFEPRDLQAGQRALPLNDLLWNVAAEWQPLARVARIRLHVRFGPRGQYVLGDDRRLRWAIGNLIDNALKYSPPRTAITLSARLAGDAAVVADAAPDAAADAGAGAEIVIVDQGYGLSPEDLTNAFTRFYRGTPHDGDGNIVRKPGTGQGLYIAQRVIEAHGGHISLASRVGTGTTAIIRLPLTAPVTLEMPDAEDESGAAELSDGQYDTVPLEPRPPHRRPPPDVPPVFDE